MEMSSVKIFELRVAACAAAILSSVALALMSAPAQAADLGTLTVTPTTGSVTTNPMFTSVTTSSACPTGYGTNAVAKVGPLGGPYSLLNRIGSANNYAAAPFTLTSNRSMATALAHTPTAGAYEIVVVCTGEILGDNPNLFRIRIVVTGDTWAVGSGGSAPGPVPTSPSSTSTSPGSPAKGNSTGVTLSVSIGPNPSATSAPTSGGTDGPGPRDSSSPTPTQSAGGGSGGGSLPRTGPAIIIAVAIGGLLIGGGLLLLLLTRRRRPTPSV